MLKDYSMWIGEWTYIIKSEVHSFDIVVHKKKLIYTEELGGRIVHGRVIVVDENRARITSKTMKFEIEIVRRDEDTHVARYRALGSKKWTKEITLLKVDEIGSPSSKSHPNKVTLHSDPSLNDNRTLTNTWRNTNHSKRSISHSDFTAETMRGRDRRKHLSSRHVTVSAPPIHKQDSEEEKLFRLNSQRKKIAFVDAKI